MDALIAKADSIAPVNGKKSSRTTKANSFKRKGIDSTKNSKDVQPNATAASISQATSIPASLHLPSLDEQSSRQYKNIKNKKLHTQLTRQVAHTARTKSLLTDAELLTTAVGSEAGRIEVEGELDKTWRVTQKEVVENAGQEAGRGKREWKLENGPYTLRYTRNGRHMAIVGRKGHVGTFDWQTGALHAELQLKETCRDITFLHDQSHFAVAQKKYVFIYDQNGVELHRLSSHIEPTALEFLPYHWLLASVGHTGFLKYQDTSTGQIVAEHRTKLGACETMCQNIHNAVIYLGHHNGTVTLWTPNIPHPVVQQLSHVGSVTGVSVDPSTGGRYMATAGLDGRVKVWDCRNWKGAVREWSARGGSAIVDWSAKGALAVATGGTLNVYLPPAIHTLHANHAPPPLYLTQPVPRRPLTSVRFCPFQDILTIGHSAGLSSVLVPGSGEPNFDSAEADPFENRKARREREVRGLLDKIQPDMITIDAAIVGSITPAVSMVTSEGVTSAAFSKLSRLDRLRVQRNLDETEEAVVHSEGDDDVLNVPRQKKEKEKMKMRGKNKSMKKYLRKQKKNVIDPKIAVIRAKLARQAAERRQNTTTRNGGAEEMTFSALDRFKRTS